MISRIDSSFWDLPIRESVDDLDFVEYIIEWDDGKQLWADNHHRIAKAVRYRHRMNGFQPFYVQATRALPGGEWQTVWDLEWTERDMTLTADDLAALFRQRVPAELIDRLFKHPGLTLADLQKSAQDITHLM